MGKKFVCKSPYVFFPGISGQFAPGPGQYYDCSFFSSYRGIFVSKWKNMPHYRFGISEGRKLQTIWTKNETYYVYSSTGAQLITTNRTEGIPEQGKSTRTTEQQKGELNSMMERQHVPDRIFMLNF